MAGNSPSRGVYLALDELTINPRLARRLPVDLARHFHALPLAEERGRITVAMAYPDDTAARQAIENILGSPLYVVQADPSTIDALVTEIWGEKQDRPLGLAVCSLAPRVADEVWDYAQSLARLLGAQLGRMDAPPQPRHVDGSAREGEVIEHDLVIFAEPDLLLIQQVLSAFTKRRAAVEQNCMPFAILAAQRPRWPLNRILFLLGGEEGDDTALKWVERLAQLSGSAVTVLVVVPPTLGVAEARTGLEQGLPGLLSSMTRWGRHVQAVARHLANSGIEGTLRLRQGPPDWQIGHEVVEEDYDLVAVGAQIGQWWRRCQDLDLLASLLRWTDRPVLVVNPMLPRESFQET